MPALAKEQRPDWVDTTPPDVDYDLTMYDHFIGAVQEINLTRDEFIALKRHLATLRGYPATNENEQAQVERISATE